MSPACYTCKQCRRKGHLAKDCPESRDEKDGNVKRFKKEETPLSVTEERTLQTSGQKKSSDNEQTSAEDKLPRKNSIPSSSSVRASTTSNTNALADPKLGERKLPKSEISAKKRENIVREVLENHISPGDLSEKYNISDFKIRDWVKKTGSQLLQDGSTVVFVISYSTVKKSLIATKERLIN